MALCPVARLPIVNGNIFNQPEPGVTVTVNVWPQAINIKIYSLFLVGLSLVIKIIHLANFSLFLNKAGHF